MRVTTAKGRRLWLTYGMNVHPGGTLDSTRAAIQHTVRPLRERLGVEGAFGLALRFDAATTARLAGDESACLAFADELEVLDLHPFTANAFVAGTFHGQPVKEAVYAPAWTAPERVAYTLQSAEVLVRLARRPGRLSISTAPGSWRAWGAGPDVDTACARHLAAAAEGLRRLEEATGRHVDLGLEPEPGCTIQTVDEAVAFFRGPLADALGSTEGASSHLGLCYDVCHQAVVHEDVSDGLARLQGAGIRVVKLQASCALEVPDPEDLRSRRRLAAFDEEVYLHQVGVRADDGRLHVAPDLGAALHAEGSFPTTSPWRVHFHVPVYQAVVDERLRTTRPHLDEALCHVASEDLTDHVEVETYTWDVLPPEERAGGLVRALERELRYVRAWLEGGRSRSPTPGGEA